MKTVENEFTRLVRQCLRVPIEHIETIDLKIIHLSLGNFQLLSSSENKLTITHPSITIEVEAHHLGSPNRILSFSIQSIANLFCVENIILELELKINSNIVLSSTSNESIGSFVAVIPNQEDLSLSSMYVPVYLSSAADSRLLLGELQFFDSFRDDLRVKVSRVGMILNPDRWNLAALFIASPGESNAEDAFWGSLAPIFMSDDLATQPIIKSCKKHGISLLLTPQDSVLAEQLRESDIDLLFYNSEEQQFRSLLLENFPQFSRRLIVPRVPELAIIGIFSPH